MPTQLMDGEAVARKMCQQLAQRAERFTTRIGRPPCLGVVLVGNDLASETYAAKKQEKCRSVGIEARMVHLSGRATTGEVVSELRELSLDPAIDGILLQYPVPSHVDERSAFEAINPIKDVDGVTTHSFAALGFGRPRFSPCAGVGIIRLLDEYRVALDGMRAVVIGSDPTLGLPVGLLLLARGVAVTYCNPQLRDLPVVVKQADLVVAAVGQAHFVRGSWLKPGAVVIDAGYFHGKVGDVVLEEVMNVASLIAPVPGGIGPMTIAVLIEQTIMAAEQNHPDMRQQ